MDTRLDKNTFLLVHKKTNCFHLTVKAIICTEPSSALGFYNISHLLEFLNAGRADETNSVVGTFLQTTVYYIRTKESISLLLLPAGIPNSWNLVIDLRIERHQEGN